jgi:hypothetical protein
MRLSLGRMSTGDILDRGLNLLFSRLHIFFIINFIVAFPVILVLIALPYIFADQSFSRDPDTFLSTLGLTLVAFFVASLFLPVGTAAILRIVYQQYLGRKASLGEAFSFALSRIFVLLFTSIPYSLIICIGLVSFVPGLFVKGLVCCLFTTGMFSPGISIWYLVCFGFVIQAVMLEKESIFGSLQRSYRLGAGYRLRMLGMLLTIKLAGIIVAVALDMGLEKVLPAHDDIVAASGKREILKPWNHAIVTTVLALVGILFYTYFAVCATLLYLDLRIRKEGFDLELAIQGEGEAFGPSRKRDYDREKEDDGDDREHRREREGGNRRRQEW